jgi:type IX secretion system PorP/SprF family membrane protein
LVTKLEHSECRFVSTILRYVISALVILGFSINSFSQDQANFTQFYLNPYILNPSYAGIDGKTSVSLIYRRQWMGIDGGPSIANFSINTPINTKLATGLSVTNDTRGLLSNTSLLFTFGYNIGIKEHSFVRFGISAGGAWNMIDLQKLDGFVDDAIATMVDNNMSINGNAGMSFHTKSFHVGFSLPSIFQPSYIADKSFNITEVKPFQSIIAHASNRFYFNDNKHVFEPYVVYRLSADLPAQFEVTGVVHLNHMIWAGGSYKQDFGISALGGIKLQNTLAIGASYSLKNSGYNELNSPTFEVSLNYLLGQHKKGTIVYSFVDTHKEKPKKPINKSASEAIAAKRKQDELEKKKQLEEKKKLSQDEINRKKTEDALARKKQEEALALHREEIRKREEARKHEVVTPPPPKTDTAVAKHNPRFKQDMLAMVEIPEGHHEHEQEQIKRLDVHAENPTETHDETHHPHAERHEFIKRGSHQDELDASDYVVGGVFGKEANAKHFTQGLVKLGFKADYGHLTEKNLWYVYLTKTSDINKARTERDKYRKMKIFRDAWLLTVHH